MGIAALIALLGMVVMWSPAVSDWMAKMFNTTSEKVKTVARVIVGTIVGVILLLAGLAVFPAIAIVGIALIAVGAVMAVYSMWPLFTSSSTELPAKG